MTSISNKNVQVQFPNGREFTAPAGTTVEKFVEMAELNEGVIPVTGCIVNGRLTELSTPVTEDADIQPVDYIDADGARIYRRTLSYVLSVAARMEFPQHVLSIQHSLPWGGFYTQWEDGEPMTDDQRDQIKACMDQLIEDDLPIRREVTPLDDVLAIFNEQGDEEKADLFSIRGKRKDDLPLYDLDGYKDYFHGFMLPSTGYLYHFDFVPYGNGAVLQFPRRSSPTQLQPYEVRAKFINLFEKYGEWLQLIGVPNVATLNQVMHTRRLKEVVLVAEALHTRQFAHIANEIESRRDLRIILISGPTSSGKTSFAKRLAIHLIARGLRPITLGLDRYFVNRVDTPLDENGEYDYEHFDALDRDLFRTHIDALLAGEEVTLPVFDFVKGERNWDHDLVLEPDQVLLVEGIHALNPELMEDVVDEVTFKIFVSALTQLNLDKHNRIPTTDTRLLRRIVRNHAHRDVSAEQTIRRWKQVRISEGKWVLPYQEHADALFNSALVYELSAIKSFAEPLLLAIDADDAVRLEANRLRAFLQWFEPFPEEVKSYIPGDSLLREFIGGSIMEDFDPWIPDVDDDEYY